MDDWELIRVYAQAAPEAADQAFARLVHRYIHLVYSAALRYLGGNHALAEDVTQKTFAVLAAKARGFTPQASLVGWLYKTACNLARDTMRLENRRRAREVEATQMHMIESASDTEWEEIAPLIETAMLALPESERTLILLRFFERKPFRQVAAELNISEEAARMRASRALQKLRAFFAQRGVTISSVAIGNVLLDNAVTAAPTAFVASLAAISSLQLATTSVPVSLATKWILMTTLQKVAVVTAALLLAVGFGSVVYRAQKTDDPSAVAAGSASPGDGETNRAVLSRGAASTNGAVAVADNPRLDRAIGNLRRAITDEWPDRRLPMARLRDAISDFGADRKATVPVLLEYLNGPRANRSLTAMAGAAFCLELLGTDAASALPDLLILLDSGDLGVLNDGIPRLFVALSPDGGVVPELLKIFQQTPSRLQLISALEKMFEDNPAIADEHRAKISAGAMNGDLASALLLARMPGPKDPAAVPVLTNALHVARLSYAIGQDFLTEDGVSLKYYEHEAFQDDVFRLSAIQALAEIGPAASNALPALIAFANLTPTNSPNQLRDRALEAIGRIDPDYRLKFPEVDRAVHEQERTAYIIEQSRAGSASIVELTEGLRLRNAADFAAEALMHHPEARTAIADLVYAVDEFESSSAVDALKQLSPETLIERVKSRDTRAINDVARTLGELGPNAREALPDLIALLNETHPTDSNLGRPYALDEAIHKIDPTQPKLLYRWPDLDDAQNALNQAIFKQGKHRDAVHDAYIRDFQDLNAVSRGHLLRFVETIKSDPALHQIFVKELLIKNPELGPYLTNSVSN